MSRTVPTQYLTTVSIHRWRLDGYMSCCLLHSVGIHVVRRWRWWPDGYVMLLITFGGYMLYDDDGDGLMDMQCCLLQSVGICWICQRWHTLAWEPIRIVLATDATKNGKAIPSGRQATYKVYSFARHYPVVDKPIVWNGKNIPLFKFRSISVGVCRSLFRCGCLVGFRRFSLMFHNLLMISDCLLRAVCGIAKQVHLPHALGTNVWFPAAPYWHDGLRLPWVFIDFHRLV